MTTSEGLDLFQKASEERAVIDTRDSWRFGKKPYVVEPFFPGFRITTDSGAVSYRMSSFGEHFPIRTMGPYGWCGDLVQPLARIREAIARCGLTIRMERMPRLSFKALFHRKEIRLSLAIAELPWEVAYCLAHELAHFVLHRSRPKDSDMIERETEILEWFIAASCSEIIGPLYVRMAHGDEDIERPPGLGVPASVTGTRSKRQLLASRERLMNGAALIEDLFR